jgi:endonuclease/exonuclease/phosphatase family metal-dependent hydrolase
VSHPDGRVRRVIARLALAGVVVIAAFEWLLLLLRPEDGPLGVLQIFAPHLALLGLLFAAICLLERRARSVAGAVALALVVGLRFGGDWVSLPAAAPTGSTELLVASWNLEVASRSGVDSAVFLHGNQADIVALQELRPDTAAAIEADPALVERYPYRALVPRDDFWGMGVLSRLPILDSAYDGKPAIQVLHIDLGGGRRLAVVNAHPAHADIESLGSTSLPLGLDTAARNAALDVVRAQIDGLIGEGLPVVMLGDLNTTASEPAFDRFVTGLREAHQEIGIGPGWTWRPSRLEFTGMGFLRIDHVVVSPQIAPVGIDIACPPVGDHCLVRARVAVPGA